LDTYGDTSGIDTDWWGLLTRKGKQQQYNISASGGDEKTQFYTSLGYLNQEAAVIGSNFKRYNSALSLRNRSLKNLLIDFSVSGSFQNQNAPLQNAAYYGSPIAAIYFLRPTQNPFNSDGSYNISTSGALNFTGFYNPLYVIAHDIQNSKTVQVKPVLNVEYNILNGLKYSTRYGIDYNGVEDVYYNNPNHGDGAGTNGYGYAGYARYFLYDWTNLLSYHKDFLGKDLSADLKVGYEAISSKYYTFYTDAYDYSTDKLTDLVNASTPTTAYSNNSDYTFASALSNLILSYKGKYSLTGSFRRDGSSRFGADNKYGNFYSVGGAWNASEESFIKNIKQVSLLKLRVSYGISGNADIGNYTATPYQSSGYNYNGNAGTAYESIGNTSLKWEKSKQFDLGVELGLLKNRLNFIFDWYKRNSDGLLYSAPISQTTGFSSKTANIGGLQNQGIELTINATPVQTNNFTWDISANITYNVNKITSLPTNNADIISGLFRLRVGQDYRSFYTYQWAGVDPDNGDPLWYTDSTKSATTSTYSSASKAYLNKSASPKYYGGISNTFTYKGFSLAIDINYNFGNYVSNASYAAYLTDGIYLYGKYKSNLKRWTTVGQKTNVPKYVYGSTNKSNSTSSRYIYNGSYVRLRNIEFAYSVPRSVLSKTKVITSLKLYVRGSNLYTWVKDKNIPFDPEQGVNSATSFYLFQSRAATAGLVLGL
ncbi:SusC/RagA family TonB-linked outer membrane protein, partial [Parafilimonas sp.]|uniref:SusC/RagA family TonB-linked outer membrane protein n=1 Tax=Parafilimonas sp. TaxID=1969739 RepID=UPI0039E36A18